MLQRSNRQFNIAAPTSTANKRVPTRTAATKATAAFTALDDLFDDEGDAKIKGRVSDQYYEVVEDPSESAGEEEDMYSDE